MPATIGDTLSRLFKPDRASKSGPKSPTSPGAHTITNLSLGEFSIDEYQPVKVIVIGAGFSGIIAGIRFPQKIPNVQLTIYEKSGGVGGVWHNNRYPGLACDIPAHCYQLSFEEKRDWSAFYAPGHEIREYLESVSAKHKLERYIRLNHEVVHARYDEPTAKWHVRVCRVKPDAPGETEEIEDSADVLFTAFGTLSRWQMPDIPGLKDFEGELHHSAGFDPGEKTWQEVAEQWRDKRVGVVGVGSSALQLVPALQPRVQKLVNYVRGKTWLAVPFQSSSFAELLGRDEMHAEDYKFTPEELARLRDDPEFYKSFRQRIEHDLNGAHPSTQRGSPMQIMGKELFRANMVKKLESRPDIAEKLIPEFPVACRRLTPGPGYLEALCKENVDFVSERIKTFTKTGIETADGKTQDLDIVFLATGYDVSFHLPFPVLGRGGKSLTDRFTPHPEAYLSVAVDGFPNMFMALGPNSGVGSGSLLALSEFQVLYAVQAVAKMQRERLKSIEIKTKAVKDYDRYLETVYSEKCRSWYKMGKEEGRVVGLWPGSTLHALRALEHPRWEDYDYESRDEGEHSMFWLGDGQTWSEKTMTGDRAWYLQEKYLDRPEGLDSANTQRHSTHRLDLDQDLASVCGHSDDIATARV
ncbi:FAD/NAD-P-binding domain-containing protein [Epithele typhae]|uniref:FAD/NAD-P-binding domain-containing protein n=1 Tax=Epithele typhae TaxID=378194 RepID=UPI0020079B5D|nr:FAD/NAD-P-binding domain-containing protein [Epithele typhae]KAH9925847.1 FAD/NAD-P-binding domain-containing protein [Epithele typhae]